MVNNYLKKRSDRQMNMSVYYHCLKIVFLIFETKTFFPESLFTWSRRFVGWNSAQHFNNCTIKAGTYL